MHQIKMRLDEWGLYHRHQNYHTGYHDTNCIKTAMMYGVAIRTGYREPSIPEAPADIQIVDRALLELRQVHPKAYEVIRAGHLDKRRDKWLARQYRTCIRTIQRWRKYGYEWLERKLVPHVAF